MWPVHEAAAGAVLQERHRAQAELPASHGGLQVHSPSSTLGLARAAAIFQAGPALRKEIVRWQHAAEEPIDPTIWDGIGDGSEARSAVQAHGFDLGCNGLPAPIGTPTPPDPARPPAPARHFLSAFLRRRAEQTHLALIRASQAAGDTRSTLRLECTAGSTSGRSLVASPGSPGACFKYATWVTALQWRLGIEAAPCLCRNESRASKRCNEQVGQQPDHALGCPTGPLRNTLHGQLADDPEDPFWHEWCASRANEEWRTLLGNGVFGTAVASHQTSMGAIDIGWRARQAIETDGVPGKPSDGLLDKPSKPMVCQASHPTARVYMRRGLAPNYKV